LIAGHIQTGDPPRVLLPRVARTASTIDRMRGLLGRRALAKGEGLLITPCNAIHTLFMRFPIDVFFLDRERRVVKILRTVPPFRCGMALGAVAVLETMAGEANRTGIKTGDRLIWGENP
jgi:uncharacterized protein